MDGKETGSICCIRCGTVMQPVRTEKWHPNNLLLRQLQKIADSAGIRICHCKCCGKIEFFKQPEDGDPPANI